MPAPQPGRSRLRGLPCGRRSLGALPTEAQVDKIVADVGGPDARISFNDFSPIFKDVQKSKPPGSAADYVEG